MIIAHYHRARWPGWRVANMGLFKKSRVVRAKPRQRTELLCPRDTQLIMVKEKCTFLFLFNFFFFFAAALFFIALFCVCADQFPFSSTPKLCVCFKEEFLGLISPLATREPNPSQLFLRLYLIFPF